MSKPEFNISKDLLCLHYGHVTRDEGQSVAADKTILDFLFDSEFINNHVVVVSKCYIDGSDDFIDSSSALMDQIWGTGKWLNGQDSNVHKSLAEKYMNIIGNQGKVWIKESDSTNVTYKIINEVLELLPEEDTLTEELSGAEEEEEIPTIVVVKHKSDDENTEIQEVIDENSKYIHLTSDAQLLVEEKNEAFITKAINDTNFKSNWIKALQYYNENTETPPVTTKVDFPSTISLMYILDIGKIKPELFSTTFFTSAALTHPGISLIGDAWSPDPWGDDDDSNQVFTIDDIPTTTTITPLAFLLASEFYNLQDLDGNSKIYGYDFKIKDDNVNKPPLKPIILIQIENSPYWVDPSETMDWLTYVESVSPEDPLIQPGPTPGPTPDGTLFKFTFDWSTFKQFAKESDNFAITWASDDNQYTTWGDGYGFSEEKPGYLYLLGISKVSGNYQNMHGTDVYKNKHKGKSYGILDIDGYIYLWFSPSNYPEHSRPNPDGEGTLHLEPDETQIWRFNDYSFTSRSESEVFFRQYKFSTPAFLQFGKAYAGARDEYVYSYSTYIGDFDQSRPKLYDGIKLFRCHKDKLMNREDYEFFKELDSSGQPVWSKNPGDCGLVISHPEYKVGRICSASYNAPLQTYFFCTEWGPKDTSDKSYDKSYMGRLAIYCAKEPWGPWTLTYKDEYFGGGRDGSTPTTNRRTFYWNFANKWLSADGKSFVMVFTGTDDGEGTVSSHKPAGPFFNQGSCDYWNSVAGTIEVIEPVVVPTPDEEDAGPGPTMGVTKDKVMSTSYGGFFSLTGPFEDKIWAGTYEFKNPDGNDLKSTGDNNGIALKEAQESIYDLKVIDNVMYISCENASGYLWRKKSGQTVERWKRLSSDSRFESTLGTRKILGKIVTIIGTFNGSKCAGVYVHNGDSGERIDLPDATYCFPREIIEFNGSAYIFGYDYKSGYGTYWKSSDLKSWTKKKINSMQGLRPQRAKRYKNGFIFGCSPPSRTPPAKLMYSEDLENYSVIKSFSEHSHCSGLAVYQDKIYVAAGYGFKSKDTNKPAKVFYYDGEKWQTMYTFNGEPEAFHCLIYNKALYVATMTHTDSGGRVYKLHN